MITKLSSLNQGHTKFIRYVIERIEFCNHFKQF